jgi:hypothetical protein
MADYGLQTRSASGNLVYDSRVAVGGVCAGLLTVEVGTPTVLTLSQYPGRSIRYIRYDRLITVSVSYSSGYPVVTLTRTTNYPGGNGGIAVFVY